MASGLTPHWHIAINGNKSYVEQAGAIELAIWRACQRWHNDRSVSHKQRERGITMVEARPAKLGEMKRTLIASDS